MAELVPVPFETLVRRALEEFAQARSVFDLPEKSFFRPDPALDLSVSFQGRPAGTPVGPASGPHTQLVQNLVLSWLGGGRVFELKTVQVNDRLTIPRPCIHVPNLGYNVEWSQELRIEESLREYVGGAMLIEILAAAGVAGPRPTGTRGALQLDLSLGYSLEGIRSAPVRRYVERMKNAHAEVEALRARIPAEYARWRDLPFPTALVHNVTLSTFHGCPADEIESIVNCLLTEMDLDVVVKMNPTLIGREKAEWLMHEVMGYRDLRMNSVAFERDISFAAATAMIRRQQAVARARGRRLGVKMSNTLEVLNAGGPFSEKVLYLSGQPLHVLALHGVEMWRKEFGPDLPISFSAGADAQNFAGLVSIDLVPVTTCTDLLRPGGYARLPKYLTKLEERMRALGVADVADFILKAGGHGAAAIDDAAGEAQRRLADGEWPAGAAEVARAALADVATRLKADLAAPAPRLVHALAAGYADARASLARWQESPRVAAFLADLGAMRDRARGFAGARNTPDLVAATRTDPRYASDKNKAVPKRIDSKLVLFDCITCDKCVPVCPNDAIFRYTAPAVEATWVRLTVKGGRAEAGEPQPFRIARQHQLACYADACNECGNCDTFCPEIGGPYVEKPRLFGSVATWEHWRTHDGFVIEKGLTGWRMLGRIRGREYRLEVPFDGGPARFDDGKVSCELAGLEGKPDHVDVAFGTPDGHTLDLGSYLSMRAILDGMRNPGEVNFVNARWR